MFYAVCSSSVGFKQLRETRVPITKEKMSISKCTHHEREVHNLLVPFLCDDQGLEMIYLEKTADGKADEHVCKILKTSL